jgi:hypothetical protein
MLLKKSSRGKDVKTLQERLKKLGFFNSDCTGYYGSVTFQAVWDYQEKYNETNTNKIKVDGITGDITWGLLFSEKPDNKPVDNIFNFDNITPEIVQKLMPQAPLKNIQKYLPGIMEALKRHQLNDKDMFLMAIGTINVETGIFKPLDEYISKYNTPPGGEPYSKYDFRQDLGNNAEGDGSKYKGRGFIQLTGKYNYKNYGKLITKLWGRDILLAAQPELANDPEIAAEILVLFLKDRETKIRTALNNEDYTTARKLVNGGTHGIDEFTIVFERSERILK